MRYTHKTNGATFETSCSKLAEGLIRLMGFKIEDFSSTPETGKGVKNCNFQDLVTEVDNKQYQQSTADMTFHERQSADFYRHF